MLGGGFFMAFSVASVNSGVISPFIFARKTKNMLDPKLRNGFLVK
jgi:hypothetical protein